MALLSEIVRRAVRARLGGAMSFAGRPQKQLPSISLYFADPAAKVMGVFRAKGFRISRDGQFPSTELYAGISATRGEGAAYGKSELGCGV